MPRNQLTERTEGADKARRARMLHLAAAGAVAALAFGTALPAASQNPAAGATAAAAQVSVTLHAQPAAAVRPLGDGYEGIFQNVSRNPKDYVTHVGPNLPAPGGTKVSGTKWRKALNARVATFYDFPADDPEANEVYRVRTIWAKDDGQRRLAVVGVFSNLDDAESVGLVTLAGPSGAKPSELTVAQISGYWPKWSARKKLLAAPPSGLVAIQDVADQPEAKYVAGFPVVTQKGQVRTTWHRLTQATRGLWIGDLGKEGKLGTMERAGSPKHDTWEEDSWLGAFNLQASWIPGRPKTLWDYLAFKPWVHYAHADAKGTLTFRGQGSRRNQDVMTGIVRIGGTRTAGGGWIVTGDVLATRVKGRGVGLDQKGVQWGFNHLAAPNPRTGETPFVGFELPDDSNGDGPLSYVMAWAPDRVATVRSGSVKAKVVKGIALLDLRGAGQRTAKGTPHQSVLIEGLDADGHVIARARVHEPDFSARSEDPSDWRPNPHDGYPQTVIAWP